MQASPHNAKVAAEAEKKKSAAKVEKRAAHGDEKLVTGQKRRVWQQPHPRSRCGETRERETA